MGRKGGTGLDSNIRGGVFWWSSFEEFHGARMTEITAVSIVSTCSDAIMSSGVARGGFSMSPGIRSDDAYMRLDKRPWLLAKAIQRKVEEKKKKKRAIYALNGIVFAGRTVGTSEWSTEGMTSDCGTLSGKLRVQVVA